MNIFTNVSKILNTFARGNSFLLQENSGFLLLENGYRIVLDQSFGSKPINNFTNQSK